MKAQGAARAVLPAPHSQEKEPGSQQNRRTRLGDYGPEGAVFVSRTFGVVGAVDELGCCQIAQAIGGHKIRSAAARGRAGSRDSHQEDDRLTRRNQVRIAGPSPAGQREVEDVEAVCSSVGFNWVPGGENIATGRVRRAGQGQARYICIPVPPDTVDVEGIRCGRLVFQRQAEDVAPHDCQGDGPGQCAYRGGITTHIAQSQGRRGTRRRESQYSSQTRGDSAQSNRSLHPVFSLFPVLPAARTGTPQATSRPLPR